MKVLSRSTFVVTSLLPRRVPSISSEGWLMGRGSRPGPRSMGLAYDRGRTRVADPCEGAHVKRAGSILLGASLVALLVWLVPVQAASRVTRGPSSAASIAASEAAASRVRTSPSLNQVEKLVAASVKVQRLNAHTSAELSTIASDNADAIESMPVDCSSATHGCVFGDARSDVAVVLFGDSHARMWLPAIIPVATADHLKLIVIGRDGCPLVAPLISRRFGSCASVVAHDVKVNDGLKPAAVIISERTSYTDVNAAQWQAGLTETIDGLRPSGARIAMIGDIQVFSSNLLLCLAFHPSAVQDCAVSNPNGADPGQEHAEERATSLAHDLYVDPNPWLCTRRSCSPVIGDNIVYWDAFHVSVNYAIYLTGVMGKALSRFLSTAMLDVGA